MAILHILTRQQKNYKRRLSGAEGNGIGVEAYEYFTMAHMPFGLSINKTGRLRIGWIFGVLQSPSISYLNRIKVS